MERYIKNINFSEIGVEGQKILCSSSVVIIGAGGLGSNFANHFVRAGFGRVRIIDKDKVELSNLQRQWLYDEEDIGKYKAQAAFSRLSKVNSEVKIEAVVSEFNNSNAEDLVRDFDIVMDATDNFKTRFLIDDICFKLRKPWVFTGILGAEAQTMLIIPGVTPTLKEFMDDIGTNCTELQHVEPDVSSSVLSPSVSIISSIAVLTALKFLIKKDPQPGALITFDTWNNKLRVWPGKRARSGL
ncbi:MAG: HesA/MoeB/ThiF family protein [Pseudomonadota bacterium]